MIENDFFAENNIIHQEKEQQTRQKSALKLNVGSVNTETHSGIINDYEVHLDFCPCRDFAIRRLPCKHMYRLAHELDVFQLVGNVKNDIFVKNHIATKEERKALKIEISNLSKNEKTLLYDVVYKYVHRNESVHVTSKTATSEFLLANDLVQEIEDLNILAKQISKPDLVHLIKKNNCIIKLSSTKLALLEHLNETCPHVVEEFKSQYVFLFPSDRVKPHVRSFYNLLVVD